MADPHTLSLGYSPCPNDTFIFDALVHGRIPADGMQFTERLEDVETLNRLAAAAELDVTKISYGAAPALLRDYVLLRSGGALGRGCGPLIVSREPMDRESLRGKRIAIPGRNTTANLLLRLFAPDAEPGIEVVYSDIMPAVARGDVDAGLIIHESRFTYPQHGLVKVADLGEWWEQTTGLPIPLGGIMARRALGEQAIREVDAAIRRSVEHAFAHPEDSRAYVRAHAQEMDDAVAKQHIDLYVNRFSVDVEPEGERAIRELFRRAADAGLLDADHPAPFLDAAA
ncbi:1,4-dihydroxy-6-naphthoate synthase [Longimicrobium terrae]|uniref:1,4-dihydroxy-6-naphtoate synthase n=1 Tax=Longimicrobium terrae TaxID=1639882 RepID=A0A841H2E1_9BACT|nr:1,4-dihydroxy-6-naphthoate synthase [Longimicrobium terrae]MBB4637916.1 1,4-dihydroxy-6-naphthoate synthase [Longimicrobium terrae]MBB6072163.1 1,4-dihydroxy-6-naphthoate synthase [Longimicrobium terrae]NNC28410.1 1,4-dihydroxy-6-naphthoate synthase [Longimicrobium terrae]